jgi:hypothetical protein
MKKVLIIVLSFLLAVKANYAQAVEPRCSDMLEIQPAIQDIQDLAAVGHTFSKEEYETALTKLTDTTKSIAVKFSGCDDYTDDLIAQMYSGVAMLTDKSAVYRPAK